MNRLVQGARLATVAMALAGVASCSGAPPANPFRGEVSARDQTIDIYVENLHFNDATLHVIADGSRSRLGMVSGKQEQNFTIPWTFVRDLSISISLLAGGEYTTPRLSVNPQESVRLIIQRPLNRSYLIR